MEEDLLVIDTWRVLDDFPVMEMMHALREGNFCLGCLANQSRESALDVILERSLSGVLSLILSVDAQGVFLESVTTCSFS